MKLITSSEEEIKFVTTFKYQIKAFCTSCPIIYYISYSNKEGSNLITNLILVKYFRNRDGTVWQAFVDPRLYNVRLSLKRRILLLQLSINLVLWY